MLVVDGTENLKDNLWRQLSLYWGAYDRKIIEEGVDKALSRLEAILTNMNKTNNYIWRNSEAPQFTPYNSAQYSVFLYLLSNEIFRKGGDKRGRYCLLSK